jgi:hypothetical protein
MTDRHNSQLSQTVITGVMSVCHSSDLRNMLTGIIQILYEALKLSEI